MNYAHILIMNMMMDMNMIHHITHSIYIYIYIYIYTYNCNDVRHEIWTITNGVAVRNQNCIENQSRRVNAKPWIIAVFAIWGASSSLKLRSSLLTLVHCQAIHHFNFYQTTEIGADFLAMTSGLRSRCFKYWPSTFWFLGCWISGHRQIRSLALPMQRRMEQPSKSCFGLFWGNQFGRCGFSGT